MINDMSNDRIMVERDWNSISCQAYTESLFLKDRKDYQEGFEHLKG